MCETYPTLEAHQKGWSYSQQPPIVVAENQRGEVRMMDLSPALSTGGGKPGSGYPAVLTSSTGDSHARTYQSPGRGPVLKASEVVSGLSSTGFCPNCGHDGRSLRMSPDFYPRTVDATLESSSTVWSNSGIASGGRFWTHNTSESRNAAAACSLSQVLQPQVSERYFLSAKAAAGILRRAERRGKELPPALRQALVTTATQAQGETEATT